MVSVKRTKEFNEIFFRQKKVPIRVTKILEKGAEKLFKFVSKDETIEYEKIIEITIRTFHDRSENLTNLGTDSRLNIS